MPAQFIRDAATLVLACACCACSETPRIRWDDATPLAPALSDSARLAFAKNDSLIITSAPMATEPVPATPTQCRESVRVARDSVTGQWYAAWWAVRPDSTADLVVAHSADGSHWGPAVRVDTLDAGRTGCRRAAPAVAADGDNVHVAYSMAAREGPGIFASHSMDRGLTFHSPVAVVYGATIGRCAIAARGNLVVVAYEDPNSSPQRVALAFSRTMGHPFDSRETMSPPTGAASDPMVALGARRIAVAWLQGDSARGGRMIRLGEIPPA